MGSGFVSVTLAPNVYPQYKPGISLVDMAGFEDQRDYVGVIGVSYFLNSIFSKARKVKFLIVLDEENLTQKTGQDIKKVFNGFIRMFNFKAMEPAHKEMLKSSIALVITKATK